MNEQEDNNAEDGLTDTKAKLGVIRNETKFWVYYGTKQQIKL